MLRMLPAFLLLMVCTCSVTSLQACGNELTALLMQRCTELNVKKRDYNTQGQYNRQQWKPQAARITDYGRDTEREELIRGQLIVPQSNSVILTKSNLEAVYITTKYLQAVSRFSHQE